MLICNDRDFVHQSTDCRELIGTPDVQYGGHSSVQSSMSIQLELLDTFAFLFLMIFQTYDNMHLYMHLYMNVYISCTDMYICKDDRM